MSIGTLARQHGTTPHAIHFYEQRGLLPAPKRSGNGYCEYTEPDAELATMCAARRCDEVSDKLRALLVNKRHELARRIEELRFLDRRVAHLVGQLQTGATHPGHPTEGGGACPDAVKNVAASSTLRLRNEVDARGR